MSLLQFIVFQLQSLITGKMNMKRYQMTAAAAMDRVHRRSAAFYKIQRLKSD